MIIIKPKDSVPAVPVQMDGAENVSVRVLLGPGDGAPTFAMRQFEIAPDGCTPHHTHPFEHEVYVVAGALEIVTDEGAKSLAAGDVVLVPADEKHQFRNTSSTDVAKMLCLIPIEHQCA